MSQFARRIVAGDEPHPGAVVDTRLIAHRYPANAKPGCSGSGGKSIRLSYVGCGAFCLLALTWAAARADEPTPSAVRQGGGNFANRVAAFSPDGKMIVVSGWAGVNRPGILVLADAANLKDIAALTGHNEWVTSAVFTPDGK